MRAHPIFILALILTLLSTALVVHASNQEVQTQKPALEVNGPICQLLHELDEQAKFYATNAMDMARSYENYEVPSDCSPSYDNACLAHNSYSYDATKATTARFEIINALEDEGRDHGACLLSP